MLITNLKNEKMKKLLYLFLVIPLMFSSCSKDDDDTTPNNNTPVEGCMDALATNYNSNATADCAGTVGGTDMSCCDYPAVTGCTDPDATNYNANATSDDGSCIYDITNAVWSFTSQTLNGVNIQDGGIMYLQYFWADGTYGWEEWDLSTMDLIDYAGGTDDGGYWDVPADNVLILNDGYDSATFTVDMTDNDNMTWTLSGPGGELVIELERTTLDVNNWK